ncbi:MAG TPA: hypothetical protein V6C65_18020, partial [Allocoleopsis sp.]
FVCIIGSNSIELSQKWCSGMGMKWLYWWLYAPDCSSTGGSTHQIVALRSRLPVFQQGLNDHT